MIDTHLPGILDMAVYTACCDSIKIKFSIHKKRDEDHMDTRTSAKGDEVIKWVHECLLILISICAQSGYQGAQVANYQWDGTEDNK